MLISKLGISNWGIVKKLKEVNPAKYLSYIKSLDGTAKLAFGCVALAIAVVPLQLVITGSAGVKPTNDHETHSQIIQYSTNPQQKNTPSNNITKGFATSIISMPQDITGILPSKTDETKPTDTAEKASDAKAESTDAPADKRGTVGIFGNSDPDAQGSALLNALADLNDTLTHMPGEVRPPQDDTSVAAVKSENEQGTASTPAAAEKAAGDKISDIQGQINNISKLVAGESTEQNSAADKSSGTGSATADKAATPTPSPTPQPSAPQAPNVSQDESGMRVTAEEDPHEEERDIDDETAMLTLDIAAIPPVEIPAGISEEEASIEAFIEVALAQVGKPYSTGGKGPDRFDCSGFVFYALNKSGYKIDYMTSATWAGASFTTIDSIDKMKRGDVICLRGHVAIYLGDGIMVDASSKNGKIVVRDVGSWCSRNFRSAKRIWTIPDKVNITETTPKDEIELNIVE